MSDRPAQYEKDTVMINLTVAMKEALGKYATSKGLRDRKSVV